MSAVRAARVAPLAALAAVVVALLAGPAAAQSGLAAPAGSFAAEDPAVQNPSDDPLLAYGGCLAAQHTGDLLLVLDTSGSLADTDPEAARVTAAQYLLDRLATTGQRAGFTLDVAVSGFGTDYERALDWTPLDDGGLARAKDAVGTFRAKDRALDTDYWTALEGARQQLADKASAGGGTRCQAVAWFSDGGLDIEPRTTAKLRATMPRTGAYAPGIDVTTPEGAAQAEAAAATSLCRSGGLADQLRASGVVVLGVGLDGGGAPDFSLMQSIATGTDAAGTTCGDLLSPTPGDFTLATDIDSLLFAFDRYTGPGQDTEDKICQGTVCAQYAHRFVLDASVTAVDILGSSDVDGLRAVLVAPDGTETDLGRTPPDVSTTVTVSGADVAYTWLSERTVTVAMHSTGADGWAGQWSVVFVDDTAASPGGTSRTSIHITGDLLPAWLGPSELRVGDAASADDARVGLVTATTGTEVDPASLLGTLSVDVALVRPDGSSTPVGTGLDATALAAPLSIDLAGQSPGDAVVRLDLKVTTAPATLTDGSSVPGTELAPRRVDVPIVLLPPLHYPTVSGLLDFGVIEDAADVTAELPLTGPGCVWLAPGDASVVASPDQVGTVTVDSEADSDDACIDVADGANGSLPVRLVTQNAGNGSINGTLTVSMRPSDSGETLTVQVPYRADLRKPFDTRTGILAFVLALLLGPGIPLALLWVWKRIGARIRPGMLYAVQVPVTVGGTLLYRDGAPFEIRPDDLTMAHQVTGAGSSGSRELSVGSVRLRARTGWSPFGPPTIAVTTGGLAASSAQHAPTVGAVRLPLALPNSWVVWIDSASSEAAATLLVFVGAVDEGSRRALSQRLAAEVPRVIAALQARRPRPEVTGGTGPAPWTPPPGGAGAPGGWAPPPGP